MADFLKWEDGTLTNSNPNPAKRNREDDDNEHDHDQLQHHIEAANAAIVALLDAGQVVSRSQLEAVREALLGTAWYGIQKAPTTPTNTMWIFISASVKACVLSFLRNGQAIYHESEQNTSGAFESTLHGECGQWSSARDAVEAVKEIIARNTGLSLVEIGVCDAPWQEPEAVVVLGV